MSDTDDTPVVEIPKDIYVYTDDDNLTTVDAPLENGDGDQTDGMGAL